MIDLDVIEARANRAPAWKDGASTIEAEGRVYGDGGFVGCAFADAEMEYRALDFIAHAREDVPALVAEVRRLQSCAQRIYNAAKRECWDETDGGGMHEAWVAVNEALSIHPPDACPHGLEWANVGDCAECFPSCRPTTSTNS